MDPAVRTESSSLLTEQSNNEKKIKNTKHIMQYTYKSNKFINVAIYRNFFYKSNIILIINKQTNPYDITNKSKIY